MWSETGIGTGTFWKDHFYCPICDKNGNIEVMEIEFIKENYNEKHNKCHNCNSLLKDTQLLTYEEHINNERNKKLNEILWD
jgi:hypothetical protein